MTDEISPPAEVEAVSFDEAAARLGLVALVGLEPGEALASSGIKVLERQVLALYRATISLDELRASYADRGDRLADELSDLRSEVRGLIAESDGVAGLHQNGDLAPWDELIPGGRFERLSSLEPQEPASLAVDGAVDELRKDIRMHQDCAKAQDDEIALLRRKGIEDEETIGRLRRVIERDRSTVAGVLQTVGNLFSGSAWLRVGSAGRGSYEWNDDKWKEEFSGACNRLERAIEPLRPLAADLSDCPANQDEVARARSERPSFQERVSDWLLACFGPEISADRIERNHRFLEEALELVQAAGSTAEEARQLVDYVFGRSASSGRRSAG